MQRTSRLEVRIFLGPGTPPIPQAISPFDEAFSTRSDNPTGKKNDDSLPPIPAFPFAPGNVEHGRQVTKSLDVPRIFVVVEREGNSLLLSFGDEEPVGWAQSECVVPVERAIAFFTDQIRANPKDAFLYTMARCWARTKTSLTTR